MAIATPFALPEAVLTQIANGISALQAYRQYVGYSTDHIAIVSGLTVEEVENIESGYRFDKGYRDRVARALGLPEGIFEEVSGVPHAA
ncbi:DNA-binding protein [Aminobacter sp. AP02]|uniref:DNA-binding protein n=1 Tax=Aminobacter sp. AP02 TaxID=2135737 RepID=UPI000D6D2CDE|nr:DNA-binding protein [Aminobacter sp. AP02]PWK66432.1 hypothetical protein C8K44_11465 [Aminobacter sp. AP02]